MVKCKNSLSETSTWEDIFYLAEEAGTVTYRIECSAQEVPDGNRSEQIEVILAILELRSTIHDIVLRYNEDLCLFTKETQEKYNWLRTFLDTRFNDSIEALVGRISTSKINLNEAEDLITRIIGLKKLTLTIPKRDKSKDDLINDLFIWIPELTYSLKRILKEKERRETEVRYSVQTNLDLTPSNMFLPPAA